MIHLEILLLSKQIDSLFYLFIDIYFNLCSICDQQQQRNMCPAKISVFNTERNINERVLSEIL